MKPNLVSLMKPERLLATLYACLATAICSFASDTLDSEGFPVMYLRGQFNGWSAEETHRFDRSGDTYSITVNSLAGEFKISGDNWQYNYGGNDNINGTCSVEGTPGGSNWNTPGLKNLTISFDAAFSEGSARPTTIHFTTDGSSAAATSGTLPVLYINVYTDATHSTLDNEIIAIDLDHKNYFTDAEYWLDLNGCQWLADCGATSLGSEQEPLPLQIKARGNWTRRGFAKKPYKIKLEAKQPMLGLTKSKHFALLAHADDTFGYLRNFCGFDLGHRIGLPWTPAQQPVELVVNGDYRGLYFLTESIRIEKDRINISELDDMCSDPALASGGYLVELDNYDEDGQIVLEEQSCAGSDHYIDALRITPDTPEEYSELQRRFITDQFTAMNNAIGNCSDNLWAYMDLDDSVRYYIVEELISHTESYHGSTYLFRDRGEGHKWHFSPLWDCGNAFNGPTDGYFYDHDPFGNTWIPSMRANKTFNNRLLSTWKWFMSTAYSGLFDAIDEYTSHIAAAAIYDRRRWAGRPVPDGGQPVADNSDMDSRRRAVVDHLRAKAAWLSTQWGSYTPGEDIAEPARDNTPAAPLPDYMLSGVENIATDNTPDAPVEYFTIEGIRTENPVPGRLYIVRQGCNACRRIFR